MSLIQTLPTLAMCVSGALAVICTPLAVWELRYERRKRLRKALYRVQFPETRRVRAANHPVRVTKLGDARRRTSAVTPYLALVPDQIEALPEPEPPVEGALL